jgi:aldehyde dehydrogenase (NAD+)
MKEIAMNETVDNLRNAFLSGKTRSYEWRLQQLQGLKNFTKDNELRIQEALYADLHKCKFEALGMELLPVYEEIKNTTTNLKQWMEPTYTATPAFMAPATSEIISEPFGVCLIIGAFNYPITLSLMPLIGAIAAGNCVVLKPSEMSMKTEQLLAELLPQYLDKDCFKVFVGDYRVNTKLLELKWDKIFFTGSPRVGKIVLAAAAKHLTPVALELGGKSPTIIDESVTDLDLATKRIMWGKCTNAGQTCISPDYVFCHEKHYEQFLKKASACVKQFFGEDAQQSQDYSRIISTAHCERLQKMLNDTLQKKQAVLTYGGKVDAKDRFFEPTILTEVSLDSPVMSEEIFGPIMPVFKYSDISEVTRYINSGEKPLTMYIFAKNRTLIDTVCRACQSGSVLVNDTMYQYGNNHAPFGGVGNSGMGSYFGKYSFTTFSQARTILRRDDHMILDIPIRYPPYHPYAVPIFRAVMKLPPVPHVSKKVALVLVAVVAAYAAYANGITDGKSLGMFICRNSRYVLGA